MTDPMQPAGTPPPGFDWRIYADATCAGLSALVPIPLLDLAFEAVFRRRMVAAVARARGAILDPRASALLGRGAGCLPTASSCLVVPFWVLRYALRKLWRKVVYVLAMVDAVEQTSDYWHRAYLLDHVVRSGDLAPGADVARTAARVDAALEQVDTSTVRGAARQVVGSVGHAWQLLRRARQGSAERVMGPQGDVLRGRWPVIEDALARTVKRYEALRRQSGDPAV